jgi:polyisoprenoid-binding protein YceI
MKTTVLSLFAAVAALTLVSCGDVGDAPEAKAGQAVKVEEMDQENGGGYMIDTARSSVSWKAAKVTNAHDGGFRDYSGVVMANGGEITGVKINIATPSIWSDNEKLTGHLKSADFFKVDAHPTATFQADRFEKFDSAGFTHRVTGNLTMLGTTKSVVFPATISVNQNEVAAKADFIINRKDWNIVYTGKPDDLISNDVRIIFDIVAKKSEPVATL